MCWSHKHDQLTPQTANGTKMAKFIKSIFQTDKKKPTRIDNDLEEPDVVPIDERRKLSMSRSGRLKHSFKKRHSLSLEIYGGEDIQSIEKPKSMEYHVHTRPSSASSHHERKLSTTATKVHEGNIENGIKSPDEEIDNAFEVINVIDKS